MQTTLIVPVLIALLAVPSVSLYVTSFGETTDNQTVPIAILGSTRSLL